MSYLRDCGDGIWSWSDADDALVVELGGLVNAPQFRLAVRGREFGYEWQVFQLVGGRLRLASGGVADFARAGQRPATRLLLPRLLLYPA